jgi:hypothetical protein
MFARGPHTKCLRNLALHVKKTFTCSEKPEKDREEFLSRIAGITEEKRVYAGECGKTSI